MIKIGLALGGGGARGIAHIGVIKFLHERGIKFHCISGTSAGAIVGAIYAKHQDPHIIEQRLISMLSSKEFRSIKLDYIRGKKEEKGNIFESIRRHFFTGIFYASSLTRLSFISEETYRKLINILIEDTNIEELPVKFSAIAVDILNGTVISIDKGSIRESLMASSAIPGILPAIKKDDTLLVDGSLIDTVPIRYAKQLGADIVIAVDVSSPLDPVQKPLRGIDLVWRSNSIFRYIAKEEQLKTADIVIKPELDNIEWTDFGKYKDMIESGMNATLIQIDKLNDLIKIRG
ncbi:MAG: patatin-like phospholipase family protein [Deltaproteobacteria bacterium]|nr:patatin-like phospholipase family protein [Deltaproteobacteria bacterium]